MKDRRGLTDLVRAVGTPEGQGGQFAPWQFSALAGLLDGARGNAEIAKAIQPLDGLRNAARAVAEDDKASEDDRLLAVRLLGREPKDQDADRDRLAKLLRPQVSGRLQQAAVAALGRTSDRRVPETLLAGWKSHSPQLRSVLLDTLLSRDAWAATLLASIEDKCTPAAEIDPAHRRRLLDNRDPKLKTRARAVFSEEGGPRSAVVASYRSALTTPGDPAAGAAVFKRACATCHKVGNEGVEVGPDLATLTDKSPESLLVAILDPNRAVEAKYTNFTVATTDGRVLTGLIAVETATAVTLKRQEGKEDVLLRSDIEQMAGSGQSLMPEGMEKDLTPKDVADVIAFLGGIGPPPKQLAGNRPERIKPGADGTIVLRAAAAEIRGDTLTFEPKHGNLGYWATANDLAAWTFEVGRPGKYAVAIDWACDDGTAGNRLALRVGPGRIEHQVAGTGSWDTYRSAKLGEVTLAPGPNRLEIQSIGRIRGALLDLRAVELRPLEVEKPAGSCCD
jgi:putative heme-binding domain-containing protein